MLATRCECRPLGRWNVERWWARCESPTVREGDMRRGGERSAGLQLAFPYLPLLLDIALPNGRA